MKKSGWQEAGKESEEEKVHYDWGHEESSQKFNIKKFCQCTMSGVVCQVSKSQLLQGTILYTNRPTDV